MLRRGVVVVVGRAVLGVCAVLAALGGLAHVAMVVIRFGAGDYVRELNEIGWFGALAGMCALAIFVGGAVRGNVGVRIGAGLAAAGLASLAFRIIASLVSLLGDRGGERGALDDGTVGFQWLLVAAFVLWRVATRKWPVAR